MSPEGWVLTTAHTIYNAETGKDADGVNVYMSDGSKTPAVLVLPTSETRVHDFALLKMIGRSHLPFLPLGDEPADKMPSLPNWIPH